MKWFSRRPFTALLVSMALVAFLPLLLNNLFYIRFRSTVLEQQKSLAEESLRFSVQQIDRTLLELTTLSMELGDELERVEVPPEKEMDAASRMRLLDVSKSLRGAVEKSSEYVSALYLYSSGSGRAVGSDGVYGEDMVYRKFYRSSGIPQASVGQLHRIYSHGQLIPLDDSSMAFVRTVSRGEDGLPRGQLVILLKRSFYSELIDKANVEGGVFLLLDGDGGILAVSNKTGVLLDEEELSRIACQEDEDFRLQGEQAMLYTLRSRTSGYRIRAVIPYSRLLSTSREMQQYYWILLAASVTLGLTLAVVLSRRSVMPLNRIITYIEEHYGADPSGTQGLEQIRNAVDSLLDQRRTAREQLQQYETVIARNSLRAALRGRLTEGDGFRMPSGCRYAVVCFSAQVPSDRAGEWIAASRQALPPGCFCRNVLLDGSVVEVLGEARADFGEERVEALLTAQLEWLDQQSPLSFNAAFSSVCADPQELERAYGEACMAMAFSRTGTDVAITSFSNCAFKPAFFLRDWHHLDKQLLFARLIGDKKFSEAAQLLPSLFPAEFLEEYFPESDISTLHLSSLKYQFIHDLDIVSDAAGMDDETWNRLLQELIYCKTHRRLYKMMERLLAELAQGQSREPEPSEDGRIGEIRQYISQHSDDPLLSVSSVAEAFGMSANSLSQLFSRKSDRGVLDCIHDARMKKAGELLRGCQNMTIQDVSAQVGYTSILTFNRKFKAYYRQTPSDYRKGRPSDDAQP